MRNALVRGSERLERHPLAVGLVLLAFVVAGTALSTLSLNGIPFLPSYELRAQMPGDFGTIKAGDEVRIAGQRVGTVKQVSPSARGRLVRFTIENGSAPVGRDARANLRQKGVAGAYYIEVLRGDHRRAPLPEGSVIPRSRTGSYVDLLAAIEGFDEDTRAAAAQAAKETGQGLIGRGDDLSQLLADLPPALRDATPVLRSLRPDAFGDLMHWSDRTARGFAEPGKRDLERLQPAARATLEAFADRRDEVGELITRLRPFEDRARPALALADGLLEDGTAMARRLAPGMRALAAAMPDTVRLLASGPRLERAAARLAPAADPVLRSSATLLEELRPAAAALRPLTPPLEELAGHLAPYEEEIKDFERGKALWLYPLKGGKAPGANALRVAWIFTCHRGRDPFPAPDEPLGSDRKACS